MSHNTTGEKVGRSIALFSITYRWLLIPTFILAAVAISYGASNLKFSGDYRIFFGPNNPDLIANEKAQDTFGKPDNIAFVIIPKSGSIYSESTLNSVHQLTTLSWSLPYASRVDSLTNFQNSRGEDDDLIVEDLLYDPTELDQLRISQIKSVAESEPLIDGFITSRKGKATVINAVVQLPSDVANVATSVAVKARELREIVIADNPDLDIYLVGVASLSAAFEEAGIKDSSTLIPLVYLFILIVMLVALRSISSMFASLAVIMLSTMIGMGFAGYIGIELTAISLSAPTIILTIAVADAIHVISGIRSKMQLGLDKRSAIVESIGLNFTPIAITSITTVVGFLTLNFSDSPPFHHLGNITAVGIGTAWLLSITFLPSLLAVLPLKFSTKSNRASGNIGMTKIANFVIAKPKPILFSTLVICLAFVAAIPSMKVNDQWSQYFSQDLEFRQAIDASEDYFGTDSIEFILDPGASGAVTNPDFLNTVNKFANWLRSQETTVAHVFAVSDIMKRVNMNLNGDDPNYYAIPTDQTLASQFLLVYELSLPYGLGLNDRVDIDRRTTRITVSSKNISTSETKVFLNDARTWFDNNGNGYDLNITGSNVLFTYVADRNIEAMFEGAVYLVLSIFIILAIAFRSIAIGAISLIPNALPILTTFGVWALLVGTVGFSVAAVGAVAVGLVVDFTVHFLSKYLTARRRENNSIEDAIRYAFETAGSAIFFTTIILVAGFAVLATSSFKLNADLGLLTALAVLISMLVNFLVLPTLFLVFGSESVAKTR